VRHFFLALLLASGLAHAHKPSDSYLALTAQDQELRGQWDIALRDLEYAIGLDADGDGAITWGELRKKQPEIAAYAFARFTLRDCTITPGALLVDEHTDGAYAVLQFSARCGEALPRRLELEYSLFADLDPTHRGLLRAQLGEQTDHRRARPGPAAAEPRCRRPHSPGAIPRLRARRRLAHLDRLRPRAVPAVLLLPAVLSAPRFAPAFWEVFRVVTAFTVAHSITLALAALSVVSLPSRWSNPRLRRRWCWPRSITCSPVVQRGRWLVAFTFGLIHGFGFASVLTELGLPKESLLLALVGFNLGVEAASSASSARSCRSPTCCDIRGCIDG
jgi:hypothetical protein